MTQSLFLTFKKIPRRRKEKKKEEGKENMTAKAKAKAPVRAVSCGHFRDRFDVFLKIKQVNLSHEVIHTYTSHQCSTTYSTIRWSKVRLDHVNFPKVWHTGTPH